MRRWKTNLLTMLLTVTLAGVLCACMGSESSTGRPGGVPATAGDASNVGDASNGGGAGDAGAGIAGGGLSSSSLPELTLCQSPRPEVCTLQYLPVCGQVDTGVRCIRAPCPSETWRTFGNACEACQEPKTIGYVPGACGAH